MVRYCILVTWLGLTVLGGQTKPAQTTAPGDGKPVVSPAAPPPQANTPPAKTTPPPANVTPPAKNAPVAPAATPAKTPAAPASPASPADARKAMEASIARQRASVQKQMGSAVNGGSSFFTTPWIDGPSIERIAAANVAASAPQCDALPRETLDPMIDSVAQKHSLDAKLVRAVVDRESAGRPCAVSPKGAQGLMQLMPSVVEQFQVSDPFDPQQNLEAGSKLLKDLMLRYDGDLTKALSAYNAGPARVDQAGGIPNIKETINYVSAIMGSLVP